MLRCHPAKQTYSLARPYAAVTPCQADLFSSSSLCCGATLPSRLILLLFPSLKCHPTKRISLARFLAVIDTLPPTYLPILIHHAVLSSRSLCRATLFCCHATLSNSHPTVQQFQSGSAVVLPSQGDILLFIRICNTIACKDERTISRCRFCY